MPTTDMTVAACTLAATKGPAMKMSGFSGSNGWSDGEVDSQYSRAPVPRPPT